jgi:hypothetical protein
MSQKETKVETSNLDILDIGELEYGVGPSGSSEAVVGLPCFAVAGVILLIKSL